MLYVFILLFIISGFIYFIYDHIKDERRSNILEAKRIEKFKEELNRDKEVRSWKYINE